MGPHFTLETDVGTRKPAAVGHRRERGLRGPRRIILILAGALLFSWFLFPHATCCDWEGARRAQCANNLKQIQLALRSYHERYGVLPPAYVTDANGRRSHSWRVLILPFLEQQPLYDRYDFREPWDGPNNRGLLAEMPDVFNCPSRDPFATTMTSYVAITGPGTMFPDNSSVRLADVADGLDRRLSVVETSNVIVPWTAPVDLDVTAMSVRINDPRNRAISSLHRGGANVVFGDAHIGFLKENTRARLVRSLITIAGQDADRGGDGSRSRHPDRRPSE